MEHATISSILLASASPRRYEALSALGLGVTVIPADVDETVYDDLPVDQRVAKLARLKVTTALLRLSSNAAGKKADDATDIRLADDCRIGTGYLLPPGLPRVALGADTLVDLDGQCMGKPVDAADARRMISALAGHTHEVQSGLCLVDSATGRYTTAVSRTLVRFSAMTTGEIEAYIGTGEWEGAAGAYRIQQHAGLFVEHIDGSFSGIVGLPLHTFYAILSKLGFVCPFGHQSGSTAFF